MDRETNNYWLRKRLGRRAFMYGAGATAAGAAGIAAVGCGNDDDDGDDPSPTEPSGNGNGDPTATPSGNGNGNGNGNGDHTPEGNLRVSLATLMDQSSDPHYQSGGLAQPINRHAFNSFFKVGDDGQRTFDMAESLEMQDDRMTMVLTMRPDVKFWDGSDLTVEDIVWSYERWIDRDPPQPEAVVTGGRIANVEATDDRTIRISLNEPTPFEGRESTFWFFSSQAHYEEIGEDQFRQEGMGTGPFRITNNQVGQFIEMEANPNHYDTSRIPYVQTLRMSVVPELTTRIAQMRSGETDIVDGIAGAQAVQLANEAGLTSYTASATALLMIRFFQTQEGEEPWTDQRLREAMHISIDQQAIVDGLLRQGQPSPNVQLWPATQGYDEELFPVREFDPDRARQLVQDAGLEGFSFTFNTYQTSSYPLVPEVSQAVAGYWEDIGLQPQIERQEAGAYFQGFTNRTLQDVGVISWPFDPNGPGLVLTALQTGSPYGSFDGNQVIDDLAEQIAAEADPEAQVELAQQAHLEVYENYLLATAPWSDSQWVTSENVVEWVRPDGNPYVTRLESARLG